MTGKGCSPSFASTTVAAGRASRWRRSSSRTSARCAPSSRASPGMELVGSVSRYAALAADTELHAHEVDDWERAAAAMHVPFDAARGIHPTGLELPRTGDLEPRGDAAPRPACGRHWSSGLAVSATFGGRLSITPHLPSTWDSLEFSLRFRDRQLDVVLTHEQDRVTLREGRDRSLHPRSRARADAG